MIKEIKYNGYTANPSDYECADGDLALAINTIQEDGAMKPVLPPLTVLQLSEGTTVKYIHSTAKIHNYITLDANNILAWWDGKDARGELGTFTTIHQVTAVGNTLIVLADDGMHYLLWKDKGYLNLGTEIPECSLSFGLQGEFIISENFTINFNSISSSNLYKEFSDENKTKVTEQVLAKVNKFIAENSTNKGRFIYPFLLRYAYRLYDGTLTKHSAPILMVTSSDLAPQVFWKTISGSSSYSSATLNIASMLHVLDYAVSYSNELNELKKWEDIVRSVDIFISKPIYTYNQNGECTGFANNDDDNYKSCYAICKHTNQKASTDVFPLKYQYNPFRKLYAFTDCSEGQESGFTYPKGRLLLPRRSTDEVKEDIKNCSSFYFLESIKLEQLKTERTIITVKEDYLQSLVAREVMTDDYDSHDKLRPKYSFPYNGRLNITDIQKTLFKGYNPASLFTYSNGYIDYYPGSYAPDFYDTAYMVTMYVYIKQDGKDIIVKSDIGLTLGFKTPLLFFYYPNINAYKAVVRKVDARFGDGSKGGDFFEIPLEQHAFLNGAFYFSGWDGLNQATSEPTSVSTDEQRTINIPNKIYTSEVNNPFYFPLLGINTVGTGDILGISSAAKALSEGQFGQFPLYAFTTEGVWALEVSSTGTYSAKQPITRDVVINPDSITQIDSAVLFATDRGIMHISGSTIQCISDSLNTADLFTIADLPKADKLVEIFNSKANESKQTTLDNITLLPFYEFLRGCRMVYDYTHQRIVVYNSSVRYSYVYSLKSHTWGMMQSTITGALNSYPEALAMTNGNKLVDFSKTDAETTTTLIITRPFKMDDPNIFKTIDSIIQRGVFHSSHVQQVLYGSNNLYNWQPVWSSIDKIMRGFRGTPYKAYRLALVCSFDKRETLYGCTVAYVPRMTNKIR